MQGLGGKIYSRDDKSPLVVVRDQMSVPRCTVPREMISARKSSPDGLVDDVETNCCFITACNATGFLKGVAGAVSEAVSTGALSVQHHYDSSDDTGMLCHHCKRPEHQPTADGETTENVTVQIEAWTHSKLRPRLKETNEPLAF